MPLLVEERAELETGISLPVVGFVWLVAGVVAAAVMVCAVVLESVVDEFATGVEAVETGVETGVGAVAACATGLFAVVAGGRDEFTVGVTGGAGLLSGTGVGADAVRLAVVGAGAATGTAMGAGVVATVVVTGVDVVGAGTGIAGVLDGSGVVAGVAAWAVETAGVSGVAADAGVVARGETVVATVVVVEVVGSGPFVHGVAPRDVGGVVMAVTAGKFWVLCNCEAWSIA